MDPSIRTTGPDNAHPREGRLAHRVRARSRRLAAGVVVAMVAGLLGLGATHSAEAATVGAGSYADTLPAGRSLPTGCGSLSTNPRQCVTANAPAGAVPTNDWWSSMLFKKTDCAYSEPLHAHPISYDTVRRRPRLLLQHHARDQRHRHRGRRVPLPVRRGHPGRRRRA